MLPEEKELLKNLGDFSINMQEDFHDRLARLKNNKHLATSLLKRNSIPKLHLSYFNEPKHNLSNPRKSQKQIFEDDDKEGTAILENSSFLKYLLYFIFGPIY